MQQIRRFDYQKCKSDQNQHNRIRKGKLLKLSLCYIDSNSVHMNLQESEPSVPDPDDEAESVTFDLEALPDGVIVMHSSVTQMSDNVIAYAAPNKDAGIFVYDICTNKWELLVKYPLEMTHHHHMGIENLFRDDFFWRVTLAFNAATRTFYLGANEFYEESDIQAVILLSIHTDSKKCIMPEPWHIREGPIVLCVDGMMHCFLRDNGEGEGYHWTYDEEMKNTNRGKAFPDCKESDSHWGWSEGTMVYIQSRDMILHLCGRAIQEEREENETIATVLKGVKCCDNDDFTWSLVTEGIPMRRPNAVVTADQNYVIISEEYDFRQDIYVLDIDDDFKWKQSSVKIRRGSGNPDTKHRFHESLRMSFRTGNNLDDGKIAHGYTRLYYGTQVAVVICDLIQTFYSQELIHWVTQDYHIAVPLENILSNLK